MKKIEFPVLNVKMVPISKVKCNDYNPNKVAPPEMKLLKVSIEEDGYTQPIVCFHDKNKDLYIIVDGFHRYRCAKEYFKLEEIPIVVINKPLSKRKASTIRHNRARGKHEISSMINLVADLYKDGWDDLQIAKELGMDADEVLRFKQGIGLPEIFKDQDYSLSWYPGNEVTN